MATTIAVAVSGGADSLAALALLRDAGHETLAVHGLFLPDASPPKGLTEACAGLGAPLEVIDLRADFERLVVRPFVDAYLQGETPNPCAACNAAVKFGLLLDRVLALGAGSLATGHYARLDDGALYRGADASRDQSYFLSLVPARRLERARFPLGGRTKAALREDLARRGITPPLPQESREVCFVPGDDYRAFLQARLGAGPGAEKLPGPGPIVDEAAHELGRHAGLWRFTLGQRRGIGVAAPEPLYVLRKDAVKNALVVGPARALEVTAFSVDNVNFLAPLAAWPEEVLVQCRYRQRPVAAGVQPLNGGLLVTFAEPEERPAPGQVAAFYEGARVLAGGLIRA